MIRNFITEIFEKFFTCQIRFHNYIRYTGYDEQCHDQRMKILSMANFGLLLNTMRVIKVLTG